MAVSRQQTARRLSALKEGGSIPRQSVKISRATSNANMNI